MFGTENQGGRGVIKTGGGKRAVPCYVGHDCFGPGKSLGTRGTVSSHF